MISVIILTFNDEVQLENCLHSVREISDDIIVVDSFSVDSTRQIALKHGARFFQNKFINQGIQFNWALDNIEIKNSWVLRLDSDEVVPAALAMEIMGSIGQECNWNAFSLNRKMYWMGKWLRYGRMYPHYITRLFRKGFARYEEKTEEHLVVIGDTGRLREPFFENNLKNCLEYFTEKHLLTARGEIAELIHADSHGGSTSIQPSLLGTKVERTRWIKYNLYNRTPLFIRPICYFLYRYFFCLGILDGYPGLIFHVLQGFWYRFYIDARLYEEMIGIDFVNKKVANENN